jgi:hypothetical protein
MIANQMYDIELPSDETFLSSSKNIMVISTIFQQAIRQFVSIYSKKEVPLTFLQFYINEIRNYNYMFRKQTKDFFELYDRMTPNFDIMAEIYTKSYYSQATCVKTIRGEKYLILKDLDIIDYSDDMQEASDKEIVSSITNIMKITEHINSSDEIIPFHKNYENYMISQIVKKNEFNNSNSGNSKVILNIFNNEERPQIISATKRAERLTSERIDISKKRGKVTKIIIPKLKLPTTYPKTVTFNRYNSKFRARNFVSASREILILNDLRINGVAYSDNFVAKRKAINEGTIK